MDITDENRHKLRFTANTHDGNEYIEMQKGNNSSKIANTHWHSSNGLFMSDGKRKIDYVLAYEVNYDSDYDENDNKDDPSTFTFTSGRINGELRRNKEKQANKRENFERNLEKLGLELEYVEGKYCKKTYFVLIHAPFALLMKQAENLAVKMPILRSDVKERTVFEGMLDRFLERFKFFKFDEITNERLKEPNYFTAPFIAAHLNCYVGHENPVTFFDDSERSRMVYDLLIRTRYDSDEKYRVGIERLINNGSYTAAFPLHEECESKIYDAQNCNNREMLYWNWALITNFYKYQPLSLIRKYFGSKIGIYFAWLGFYTKVLFPASILGILSLLYGLSTFSRDIPSNDICGTDGIGASIIICPACESFCDFARLNSSCIYSKLSYLFDNRITVVFAALMTISATLFLEGWKRYHAEFAWKWGLLDFEIDEETIRPEYQLRVKSLETKRVNPITQQMEPYFPFKKRLFRFVGSGVSVIFFLLLVIAFVIGIVIYRIVLLNVLYRMDGVKPYAALLTFSTASFLNLVVILMLSYFYTYLAIKLTEWECPRTQTDFDNSYTFKVYLFQFINYYSSIFYIAFIKGNLSSVPGRHFFGFQPEECDPAGCMVELVIQLAIIMCGKQFWNAFIEIAWPMMMNIIRSWNIFASKTKQMKKETIRRQWQDEMKCSSMTSRWEQDYVLNPVSRQFLFDEYLEMVIQFGFVTLFVSAFPLAPLFALLNNILEIRIDAYKYTMTTRRPVPERAKDIGVWFSILDGISRAAVLINAFIISFTSDFIPKLVYQIVYNHDELYGYVNNSLSYFDISSADYKLNNIVTGNITICRFRDYRQPPCTVSKSEDCNYNYDLTIQWWVVLAFRLAFIIIFEHVVSAIKSFVAFIIPDIPSKIFIQLQRQKFLSRQARLLDLSGNNEIQSKFSGNIISSDIGTKIKERNIAFQPDLFGTNDQTISQPFKTVMRHESLRNITASLRSTSADSFCSCYDDRTEKI